MSGNSEKITDELKLLSETIEQLAAIPDVSALSELELAGVGTYIHNFYNGVENILKNILKDQEKELPVGGAWHKALLTLAHSEGIVSDKNFDTLKKYLAFRHFFSHGYSVKLDAGKIEALLKRIEEDYNFIKAEISKYC